MPPKSAKFNVFSQTKLKWNLRLLMGRWGYRHVLECSWRCRFTLFSSAGGSNVMYAWDDGRLPWIFDRFWCWRWVLLRRWTTPEPRKDHPIESAASQERAWGTNCRARPCRWPGLIVIGCVGRERPLSSLCRSSRSRTCRASAPITPEAGEVVLSLLRPVIGWDFW